ncbi:sensor histidine kinase [Streptomyces sp. NRRL B-24484]|uniref:sensor histidine kinase n=1 Tax=Streptomyces sp. NRRL B-24484 TaxID=1463833 RepID=UPI0004BF0F7F|nr:ATP-binding protein [Streptomyces sp. NRRL B-24484]
MRLRGRVSVRTRAALGAASAALLAFGGATVWAGRAAHDQWMPNAEAKALREATLLDEAIARGDPGTGAARDPWLWRVMGSGYQQSAYVLVLADGSWARHDRISGSATPFLPPLHSGGTVGKAETVRIPLPDGVHYDISTPVGPNPDDRTLTFLRRAGQYRDTAALAELTGRTGLPRQQVTTYVVVNEIEAKAAAARMTRLLGWYAVPGGTLFVALVAWVVTGAALRPVEAIRREMAVIGAGALDRRVPVPRAADEIGRLAATTNRTLDRLETAVVEQRRLVADASHELRTPIAVLRSSLEVAAAHPDSTDHRTVVAEALAGTARLQALADDLLLLSRTEAAVDPQDDRRTDWHDVVGELVAERAYGDGRVRIAVLEPATVTGGELLLARLVRNLLDNACRHARSEVVVALRRERGSAVLTVTDDGPGIPAADRERAFERFVRLDTARDRSAGGAGLGLALVRGIARSLGGDAEAVAPASGRGAELVVRLPLQEG